MLRQRRSMRTPLLFVSLGLLGCPRASTPSRTTEDLSVQFPEFSSQPASRLGQPGVPFVLDGVTLQALRVAANDLLPPEGQGLHCWERQDARLYRIIRQGNITFIRMDVDPARCDGRILPLDAGATYAVHADGRILRRHFDGEPLPPPLALPPAAGAELEGADSGLGLPVGATFGPSDPSSPASPRKDRSPQRPSESP